MSRPLSFSWLGRAGYRETWALQERLRRAVLDGSGEESLLLVEHPPVITLGHSAHPENVLLSPALLAARGIELVPTNRGGDVTLHAPGQLVAYPIVRVAGVRAHVEAMAAAAIEVAAEFGVAAEYRAAQAGVWVGDRKLCAFGVHVHHRVAIHGMALNLTIPLELYSLIVPCGLRDAGVTSIADLTSARPEVSRVALPLAAALARRLGRTLVAGLVPTL